MAEVAPLKGLLYNKKKVVDLSKVMAPPYDVIGPAYQDELYQRHFNNVIRLILGKTSPDDKPGSDRYSRSAEDLGEWIDEGVLQRDEKPAIYYYKQTYKLKDGTERTRKGFIARARLEELGKGSIHPHEKTLSGPKADRLNLMRACNANFSCIFSLYPETEGREKEKTATATLEGACASVEPIVDVTGDDGVVNKLWRVDDEAVIGKVTAEMADKQLFIADGHHRYETALNYRKYMREQTGKASGNEPFDYVMMYFASFDDDGLDIFPTHRVVHSVADFNPATFVASLSPYFNTEIITFEADEQAEARRSFLEKLVEGRSGPTRLGLNIRGANSYIILTLKDKKVMDDLFGDDIPEVYKTLDVTVLHSLVFGKILGISQEAQEKQENLIYVKGDEEAFEAVGKNSNQMVFIMNATSVEEVKDVSLAGLLMPQKSTYFYPKLLSGLVINPLWD